MADMILISGWIDVEPGVRDELIAASVPLQQSTRNDEPGCLAYVFAADPVVDGRIHIFEQWATPADLDAHFQHPNFKATGELLRSKPRRGGETTKFHVDRTGPVRDADGQASATYWPDG
jgi:quinol monooxygenase YgiN